MEKATYSLSALKQCKGIHPKKTGGVHGWKAEHNSRCAEVNVLFASCQKLLNYVMFQPDLSLLMTITRWFPRRNARKKQLDNQLRVCHSYAETQISLIEKIFSMVLWIASHRLQRTHTASVFSALFDGVAQRTILFAQSKVSSKISTFSCLPIIPTSFL